MVYDDDDGYLISCINWQDDTKEDTSDIHVCTAGVHTCTCSHSCIHIQVHMHLRIYAFTCTQRWSHSRTPQYAVLTVPTVNSDGTQKKILAL